MRLWLLDWKMDVVMRECQCGSTGTDKGAEPTITRRMRSEEALYDGRYRIVRTIPNSRLWAVLDESADVNISDSC